MAFGWSLYVVRTNYPGNAIAWAAGIGSVICLLFPVAISTSEKNHLRLIAFLGSGIGLIALFNNQSRGVYGIVIWLLALFFLRTTVQRIQAIHSATVSAVILAIIGSTAFITTDPLRIREAWQDATAVLNERQLNTSVGVRIYLYDVALEAIAQNPITGIGPTARLSLVKGEYNHLLLQEEVTIAAASELGHVHNAYLHHLLDGGLISLTGFLLSIIGLVHIGFILQRVSRVAAHQLWGISFVHATTNLTNVNLAHNYYALMLSISIFLAFVTAYNHRNPSEASKYKTPGT
jgi:O-antigen ligase